MASDNSSVDRLSDKVRLFVDFDDLEERQDVHRVFHQVQRCGTRPVLAEDALWENHGGMTASVIYDDDEALFKVWYLTGCYEEGKEHVQCMAVSDDGVKWRKPDLGLHEALGSRANNIVIPADYHDGQDHFETMVKDSMDPDPARRYKAIGWSSYDWDGPLSGIYTATSPDGLHWHHTPEPVFHHHPRPGTDDLGPVGDAQSMMIDTEKRRYVAFLRGGRERLLSTSDDYIHWSPLRPFLSAMHEEEALYNNTGFPYGVHYLGFLTHFDKHPERQTQTLRLLTSRDGEEWWRVPGDSLIPLGGVGEWDRFQIMLTGAQPIPVKDRLYIYYRGTARRHAKVKKEYEPRIFSDQDPKSMSIGLATLRLDGFASVSASFDGGMLTMRPMQLDGSRLQVNVKSDYGQLLVELLDTEGRPISGYAKDVAVPVTEDSVHAPVRWKGRDDVRELRGRTVKVRFHLHNARLYSYCCK